MAKEIDDRVRGMFPFIREYKSIQKAIEIFNRIRPRGRELSAASRVEYR